MVERASTLTWIILWVATSCQSTVFAAENLSIDVTELRAQLSPVRYAALSAEMSGKIASMPVTEGQKVSKGELLVAFDCSLQQAQLQKATAELSVARNTLKGSQRMAELNAIGSVELTHAQLDVKKALADLAYLNATLKRCSVKAPYAGSIGDKSARAQEFIQAGTPLLEIIDDSSLELEFIAPSRWLNWMKPGVSLEVLIEDTDKTYGARILRLAAKVDAMSQSVKVIAVIAGEHPELLSGMSGHIRISHDQIPE